MLLRRSLALATGFRGANEIPIATPYSVLFLYCVRGANAKPIYRYPKSMNISIIEPTSLTLSDKQGDFSVSVMLNIKYRNAGNMRRRVRNPWSVF